MGHQPPQSHLPSRYHCQQKLRYAPVMPRSANGIFGSWIRKYTSYFSEIGQVEFPSIPKWFLMYFQENLDWMANNVKVSTFMHGNTKCLAFKCEESVSVWQDRSGPCWQHHLPAMEMPLHRKSWFQVMQLPAINTIFDGLCLVSFQDLLGDTWASQPSADQAISLSPTGRTASRTAPWHCYCVPHLERPVHSKDYKHLVGSWFILFHFHLWSFTESNLHPTPQSGSLSLSSVVHSLLAARCNDTHFLRPFVDGLVAIYRRTHIIKKWIAKYQTVKSKYSKDMPWKSWHRKSLHVMAGLNLRCLRPQPQNETAVPVPLHWVADPEFGEAARLGVADSLCLAIFAGLHTVWALYKSFHSTPGRRQKKNSFANHRLLHWPNPPQTGLCQCPKRTRSCPPTNFVMNLSRELVQLESSRIFNIIS